MKYIKLIYFKIKYFISYLYDKWLIFKAMWFEVILENYPFYDDTFIFIYGLAYYHALKMEERGIDY